MLGCCRGGCLGIVGRPGSLGGKGFVEVGVLGYCVDILEVSAKRSACSGGMVMNEPFCVRKWVD